MAQTLTLPCARSCDNTPQTVSITIGAMERYMRGFGTQALTDCDVKNTSTRTTAGQCKGQFKGAMDESSGKGSKMQAHIISGVVMDITAFEVSHSFDIDATALQAKKRSA